MLSFTSSAPKFGPSTISRRCGWQTGRRNARADPFSLVSARGRFGLAVAGGKWGAGIVGERARSPFARRGAAGMLAARGKFAAHRRRDHVPESRRPAFGQERAATPEQRAHAALGQIGTCSQSMSRESMPPGLTRWAETGFPKRTCGNKEILTISPIT